MKCGDLLTLFSSIPPCDLVIYRANDNLCDAFSNVGIDQLRYNDIIVVLNKTTLRLATNYSNGKYFVVESDPYVVNGVVSVRVSRATHYPKDAPERSTLRMLALRGGKYGTIRSTCRSSIR